MIQKMRCRSSLFLFRICAWRVECLLNLDQVKSTHDLMILWNHIKDHTPPFQNKKQFLSLSFIKAHGEQNSYHVLRDVKSLTLNSTITQLLHIFSSLTIKIFPCFLTERVRVILPFHQYHAWFRAIIKLMFINSNYFTLDLWGYNVKTLWLLSVFMRNYSDTWKNSNLPFGIPHGPLVLTESKKSKG